MPIAWGVQRISTPRDGLAQFDLWMKFHPTDASAAAERCRFLDLVAYDEEGNGIRFDQEVESCAEDLERAFGATLAAKAYVVETKWGDEAHEAAERFFAGGGEGTAYELGVRRRIVEALSYGDDAERVIPHARRAMQLDPELDLSYELALGYEAAGETVLAIAQLTTASVPSDDASKTAMKAKLLHELGAHSESVALFERAATRDAFVDRIAWARSLESLGRIDEARTLLRKQLEEVARYSLTAERERGLIFDFELAHGDGKSASDAYQAMRDDGYWTDPIARRRLELLVAHPGASWRWRDGLGILSLLGAGLAIALVPLVIFFPIHYVGLRRTLGQPARERATTSFSLRRAWLAASLVLLAQFGALFVLWPEGLLETLLDEGTGGQAATHDSAELARFALWTSVLTLIAALIAAGGRVRTLLARGSWSSARTFAAALACLVSTWPIAYLARLFSNKTGLAATTLTEEMVRAVHQHHGAFVLLADVAVVTPIAEEILFRGVILAGIRRHVSFAWANFTQAILFTSVHEELTMAPVHLAIGLATGWLTRASASLRSAILFHAFNNALFCAAVIARG